MEDVGDAHICRKGRREYRDERIGTQTVDRKLDLLVWELKRYGVSVAGIQETKWFGNDVWVADGYTLLHSGRPLPSENDRAVRNEGVGNVLDTKATAAWKEAGEKWEAVSSRVVTARLMLSNARQRKPGGRSREAKNKYMTAVSVYVPTVKAPSSVKWKFLADLQDVLDKIPLSDILIMLGDINARVGRSDSENDLWAGVRGRHGMTDVNEAGKEFLEFCAINQLTIMNTWFAKKEIQLGTWMHPATKRNHMIDYIVMRASQRKLCTDVQVMRGANCWTDHQMVRAKVYMYIVYIVHSGRNKKKRQVPFAVHTLRNEDVADTYCECLSKQLKETPHDSGMPAEWNWKNLKSCIVKTAESTVV